MALTLNDTLGVARDLKPYGFSRPFWEATRDKQLLLQYCRAAGKYQHYIRPTSIFTGRRRDLEWRPASGKGQLFSYTVSRRAPPAFRGHEPYLVATVTLDEGVNFVANVVNCPIENVRIGMRVEAYWHPLSDGRHLFMFQPERTAR